MEATTEERAPKNQNASTDTPTTTESQLISPHSSGAEKIGCTTLSADFLALRKIANQLEKDDKERKLAANAGGARRRRNCDDAVPSCKKKAGLALGNSLSSDFLETRCLAKELDNQEKETKNAGEAAARGRAVSSGLGSHAVSSVAPRKYGLRGRSERAEEAIENHNHDASIEAVHSRSLVDTASSRDIPAQRTTLNYSEDTLLVVATKVVGPADLELESDIMERATEEVRRCAPVATVVAEGSGVVEKSSRQQQRLLLVALVVSVAIIVGITLRRSDKEPKKKGAEGLSVAPPIFRSTLEEVQRRGRLRCAVMEYQFNESSGEYQGLSMELVSFMHSNKLLLRVYVHILPWIYFNDRIEQLQQLC